MPSSLPLRPGCTFLAGIRPARALGHLLAGWVMAWAGTQAFAQAAAPGGTAAPGVQLTDRLIVKYRDASDPRGIALAGVGGSSDAATLAEARRSRLNRRFREATFALGAEKSTSFGAKVLSLGRMVAAPEVQKLADRLMADDADIEYAVPDRFVYLAQAPADPRYAQQWPLNDPDSGVRAESAWARIGASSAASRNASNLPLVAIIDTGYRPHVDLPSPNLGQDYVDGAAQPIDTGDARTPYQCLNWPGAQASSWHGLAVEGIIAAQLDNGIGIAGLAPMGAGIWHARVFGPCGGYLSSYMAAIHDAVDYRNARGQRVRVINLSQGGAAFCEAPLQAEITRAIDAGIVVVASAGNGSTDVSISSPANCAGVISVAATDRFGNVASYSNRGSGVTLAAPGGDTQSRSVDDGVLTTSLNLSGTEPTGQQSSDYNYVQGTSFSAPHVSAAAALLIHLNPASTPAEVRQLLTDTARPLPGRCAEGCGAGLLDVSAAIEKAERQRMLASVCAARWLFTAPLCARR